MRHLLSGLAVVLVWTSVIGAGSLAVDAQRRVPPPDPPAGQGGTDRTAKPREQPPAQPAERRAQPRDGDSRTAERRTPHPPHPPVGRPAPPRARGQVVFVGGYFYDPFYGPYPWWPRRAYPRYFPVFDARAQVRLEVKPREAAVYVDGYYAGIVDDFDGVLQALPLPPGGHDIAVHLEGFRTRSWALYLRPGSTLHVKETLQRLPAGTPSEPPVMAPALPEPPVGSYTTPRTPAPPRTASPTAGTAPAFGTLDLAVDPPDAEVTVDGRPWLSSDPGHFLIDLPAGTHTVEVLRRGSPTYRRDAVIRDGDTTILNVSLVVP